MLVFAYQQKGFRIHRTERIGCENIWRFSAKTSCSHPFCSSYLYHVCWWFFFMCRETFLSSLVLRFDSASAVGLNYIMCSCYLFYHQKNKDNYLHTQKWGLLQMQECHDQTLGRGRAEYLTNELSGIRRWVMLIEVENCSPWDGLPWSMDPCGAVAKLQKNAHVHGWGPPLENITKLPTAMQLHEGPYYLV